MSAPPNAMNAHAQATSRTALRRRILARFARADGAPTIACATPSDPTWRGAGMTIRTGWHDTPVGRALLGVSERGVVGLYFDAPGAPNRADLSYLQRTWPDATLRDDAAATGAVVEHLFAAALGTAPAQPALQLFVRGTAMRVAVWRALLQIPLGAVMSYGQVAALAGYPRAVRAVASAVGSNPISLVIPCHRVVRATGDLGGYHWGLDQKRAILAWEFARSATALV